MIRFEDERSFFSLVSSSLVSSYPVMSICNLKIITVVKTITYSPYPYNDSEKDLKSLPLYCTYILFNLGYQ